MNSRKNLWILSGLVLSVALLVSSIAVLLISHRDSELSFEMLNAVCSEVARREPETQKTIAAVLKEYSEEISLAPRVWVDAGEDTREDAGEDIEEDTREEIGDATDGKAARAAWNLLPTLGYRAADFSADSYRQNLFFGVLAFLAGVLLFAVTFLYRNRAERRRIRALIHYLEQADSGKARILAISGEDDFSRLEDGIYKTVTSLYQTKEQAVQTRNEFAENLSNIAHQIKTPITAISLAFQKLRQGDDSAGLEQMEKQLARLAHLEEALLTLARLDAGTLALKREEVDVFTLLSLAADNLQELFACSGTFAEIEERGEMCVRVDMEWTMEAVMNLLKNCMEHDPGGIVHCSYEQNPLYTELLIWDEGEGFAREDLPHLFERFYRGKDAGEGGIGIGLALAKEIIERQNGTIRARNRQGGGALFEIHLYRNDINSLSS